MKYIYAIMISAIALIAAESIETGTTTTTAEIKTSIRPKTIIIDYPDGDGDPTIVAVYQAVKIQTVGTNAPVVVERKNVRIASLTWPQAIALVPSLTNARVEFNSVFTNLFSTNTQN